MYQACINFDTEYLIYVYNNYLVQHYLHKLTNLIRKESLFNYLSTISLKYANLDTYFSYLPQAKRFTNLFIFTYKILYLNMSRNMSRYIFDMKNLV